MNDASSSEHSACRVILCEYPSFTGSPSEASSQFTREKLDLCETIHDLKNMLFGMNLLLRSALQELPSEQSGREHVQQVLNVCGQAVGLCQSVLESWNADDEGMKLERIDLCALLRELEPLLRGFVLKPSSLSCEMEHEAIWIEGCKADLIRAVLNLVKNAAESLVDESNCVTVSCGLTEVGDSTLKLIRSGCAPRGGLYAYIEVADAGCGMDEETICKALKPRYSSKKSSPGLGLLSVQQVVAEHGGIVELCSEPEVGTTVWILLPVATSDESVRVSTVHQTANGKHRARCPSEQT